jgi:hypothetical protein
MVHSQVAYIAIQVLPGLMQKLPAEGAEIVSCSKPHRGQAIRSTLTDFHPSIASARRTRLHTLPHCVFARLPHRFSESGSECSNPIGSRKAVRRHWLVRARHDLDHGSTKFKDIGKIQDEKGAPYHPRRVRSQGYHQHHQYDQVGVDYGHLGRRHVRCCCRW